MTAPGSGLRESDAPGGALEVRFLRPADVPSLCTLLTASFREEYERQGLDVWGFRRQYRLVAWLNRFLAPLRLDFFQVVVAVLDGRVVGTMASFPVERGRWYQGFGAVDPAVRRRGIYKWVIRRSLEGIARRGARVGGGEIRIDNLGALVPYRDVFGTEVIPPRTLYLVPPGAAPRSPAPPVPLAPVGDRDLDRLPSAAAFRARFRGGFLLEGRACRGLVRCLLGRCLPPITARTLAWREGGAVRGLARVRTHWPARIVAVDALWLAPEMEEDGARRFLAALLARLAPTTRLPLRVYAAAEDEVLHRACRELGIAPWTEVYPIRTDVALALARTDGQGRPRGAGEVP